MYILKLLLAFLIAIVVAGGCGYWYGITSAPSESVASTVQSDKVTDNSPEARFQGPGKALGKIVAMDGSSVTVEIQQPSIATTTNGIAAGSKIVFYNTSTDLGKTITASSADLSVGESISVVGTENPDGSIMAQTIQIRSKHTAGESSATTSPQ